MSDSSPTKERSLSILGKSLLAGVSLDGEASAPLATKRPSLSSSGSIASSRLMSVTSASSMRNSMIPGSAMPSKSDSAGSIGRPSVIPGMVSLAAGQAGVVSASADDSGEESGLDLPEVDDSKLKPYSRDKKGRNVVLELISTERLYVQNLKNLIKIYIDPLEMRDTPLKVKVMKIPQLAVVSSNIRQIIYVNSQLLKDLKHVTRAAGAGDCCVGDIFLRFSELFKLYGDYASNHNQATIELDKLKDDKDWTAFTDACLVSWNERHDGKRKMNQTLESCLIMPVQRIPRYELLIKELIKLTAPEHPDKDALDQSIVKVHEAAMFINETIRQGEKRKQLKELETKFTTKLELLKTGREIVREGVLTKISRKTHTPYHFHLLTDQLMYSEPNAFGSFKLHRVMPLDTCKIVDVADTLEVTNAFQLLSSSKSFIVYAADAASKRDWFKDISECIGKMSSADSTAAAIWEHDDKATECTLCNGKFSFLNRRHHCRNCGRLCCSNCSANKRALEHLGDELHRICDKCVREIDGKSEKNTQLRIEVMALLNISMPVKEMTAFIDVECDGVHVAQTSVSTSTAFPMWTDEIFQWDVNDITETSMPVITLHVWDKKRFSEPEHMAMCAIPLNLLRITMSDELHGAIPQLVGCRSPEGDESVVAVVAIRATLVAPQMIRYIPDPLGLITSYVEVLTATHTELLGAAVLDCYDKAYLRTLGKDALAEEDLESLKEGGKSFSGWLKSDDFKKFCRTVTASFEKELLSIVKVVDSKIIGMPLFKSGMVTVPPIKLALASPTGAKAVGDATEELRDSLSDRVKSLAEPTTERGECMQNIIATEAEYIRQLNYLMDLFLTPLEDVAAGASLSTQLSGDGAGGGGTSGTPVDAKKKKQAPGAALKKKVGAFGTLSKGTGKNLKQDMEAQAELTKSDTQVFFQSIKQLVTLSNKLYSDLVRSAQESGGYDAMSASQIFIDVAPLLKLYSQYCTVVAGATGTFQLPIFGEFMTQRNGELAALLGEDKNLLWLLDQPPARVDSYCTFLQRVLNRTEDTDPDYEKSSKAVDKIAEAMRFIHLVISKAENNKALLAASREITGDETLNLFDLPFREFKLKGYLTKLGRKKPKKHMCYLFTDMFIYTTVISDTKVKHDRTVPLLGASIDDHPGGTRGFPFAFTIRATGKSVTIAAESNAMKEQWIHNLENSLLDSPLLHGKGNADVELAAVWAGDETSAVCLCCHGGFTLLNRRHHCRDCGKLVCGKCSNSRAFLPHIDKSTTVRVCDDCANTLKDTDTDGAIFTSKGAKFITRPKEEGVAGVAAAVPTNEAASTPAASRPPDERKGSMFGNWKGRMSIFSTAPKVAPPLPLRSPKPAMTLADAAARIDEVPIPPAVVAEPIPITKVASPEAVEEKAPVAVTSPAVPVPAADASPVAKALKAKPMLPPKTRVGTVDGVGSPPGSVRPSLSPTESEERAASSPRVAMPGMVTEGGSFTFALRKTESKLK